MKLYNSDGTELLTITAIEPMGDNLIIKGNIFGTMPINAQLRPKEARAAFKLISARKMVAILRMLLCR